MVSSLILPKFMGKELYMYNYIFTYYNKYIILEIQFSLFLSYLLKFSGIRAVKLNNVERHQNLPLYFFIYLHFVMPMWLADQIRALKIITKCKFPKICYYPASWPLKILNQLFYITVSELILSYKWGHFLYGNKTDEE